MIFTHCEWWWIEAKLLINVYTIFTLEGEKKFCISLSFPLHHVDCWREGDIFPFLLLQKSRHIRQKIKRNASSLKHS